MPLFLTNMNPYEEEKARLIAFKDELASELETRGWKPNDRHFNSKRWFGWFRGTRVINLHVPIDTLDAKQDFRLSVWSSEVGEYVWGPTTEEDWHPFWFRSYKPAEPIKYYENFDEWHAAILEFIQ